VTDANVVLGRIDPAATLGGSVDVNYQLAVEAVGRLGDELGLSTTATALGVCRIAEDVMAGAVRSVSVDRGADPTRAMLLAYGGAGGLHATAVARSLGMAGVIIPAHAGVFSALGLLAAPPRADAVAAVHIVGVGDLRAVQHTASMLGAATTAEIVAAGHEPTRTDWWLDVRYVGQSHEIAVPWDGGLGPEFLVERFEDLHQRRNGFVRNGDSIEIVAVRSSTYGPAPVALESLADASETPDAVAGRRIVVSALVGPAEATIVPRTTLGIGTTVVGPAVIEDVDATTFIDFGERATVASNGALEVTW
jgi:N-methylhydantoinase A